MHLELFRFVILQPDNTLPKIVPRKLNEMRGLCSKRILSPYQLA